MTDADLDFEQGPIRPPNEAHSLLLRLTRNCPWNRCLFCPVYKGRPFSLRPVDEIRRDIDRARRIADDIAATSREMGFDGTVTDPVLNRVLAGDASPAARSVAVWMYCGTGACFLQDADNLVMRTDDLVDVLTHLRRTFPEIRRVTTYSRSRTVIRKSVDALARIRAAGLDRVHIGLETGCDALLRFMQKGVSADQHVEAGRRLIAAGIEVSEYVMPGLGGREMWREHARDTARVLNAINPHFIRLRSLRIPARIPLHAKVAEGAFHPQSDDELAAELQLFIESLEGITSTVTSDHIMNLLEDVGGTLPADRERMLAAIAAYRSLPDEERLVYRVGRRGGSFRSVADMARDPALCRRIRALIEDVRGREGPEGVERFIRDMADQYI